MLGTTIEKATISNKSRRFEASSMIDLREAFRSSQVVRFPSILMMMIETTKEKKNIKMYVSRKVARTIRKKYFILSSA